MPTHFFEPNLSYEQEKKMLLDHYGLTAASFERLEQSCEFINELFSKPDNKTVKSHELIVHTLYTILSDNSKDTYEKRRSCDLITGAFAMPSKAGEHAPSIAAMNQAVHNLMKEAKAQLNDNSASSKLS